MDLESIMLSEISQSGDNAQVTQELVLGEAHPSTGHHLCQVAPAHMGPKPQAAGIYHSHKGSSPCRAKKQRGASACVLFKTLSQNPTHWECPAFQPMWANVHHVCPSCLFPSFSHHFTQGARSPVTHRHIHILARSRESCCCYGLLISTIHVLLFWYHTASVQLPSSWVTSCLDAQKFAVASSISLLPQPKKNWAARLPGNPG